MNILVHTMEFFPFVGGVGVYNLQVVRALKHLGHRVTLACRETEGAEALDRAFPFPVHRVKQAPLREQARSLGELIDELKPQFTLFSQYDSERIAALAGRGGLGTYGVLFHGTEIPYHLRTGRIRGRIMRRRVGALMAGSTAFWFNSGFTRNLFYSSFKTAERPGGVVGYGFQDEVLSRPVDQGAGDAWKKRLWGDSPKPPTFITVARLEDRKNHAAVIRALTHLPDAHYLVVGTGPEEVALWAQARTLNLENRVHFLGKVSEDDKWHLLDLAHVFVMPGRSLGGKIEGLGIAYLEASSRGLPVVAADTGGVSDAVRHGETGLLTEPGNDLQLEQAMQVALEHPDLGKKGQQWVRDTCTLKAMARRLENGLP